MTTSASSLICSPIPKTAALQRLAKVDASGVGVNPAYEDSGTPPRPDFRAAATACGFDNPPAADIICIRMNFAGFFRRKGICVIRYAKPKTVGEALGLLSERRRRILAGRTDFCPAHGARPFPCRCTGYRKIVAAVSAVERHP
jgi:hypothetical protein